MPRGRQYYDPIVQVPGMVEGEQDLARIEVFMDEGLKWWGRQVASDGSLTGNKIGDFNHDALLARVREAWPTHPVYELRNESDDSTWEGHGPSPRLWQNSSPETGAATPPAVPFLSGGPFSDLAGSGTGDEYIPPAVQEEPLRSDESVQLRAIVAPEAGAYVLLSDILGLLESWAVSFEIGKNPSGAMALREAVDMLRMGAEFEDPAR